MLAKYLDYCFKMLYLCIAKQKAMLNAKIGIYSIIKQY